MVDFISMKGRARFFSPGTLILLGVMVVGFSFALARLLTGLGPVTNLSDSYPWGIWIAIDVAAGVALAAGGFTTAALVNIIGNRRFHHLERAALLTAWLGYVFVGVGLLFDLGRPYNIWHPAIYWQGNSALFEVGMCVMFYLTVLTVEMTPALTSGLLDTMDGESRIAVGLRKVQRPVELIRWTARRVMPIFIIAGVVLSTMHQSSLGTLMVIAPSKLHHLWWTPILPINFLLSAIMIGFPMVIFESLVASRSFGRKLEMDLLEPLSRYVPWFMALYAGVRLTDLFARNDLSLFWQDATATTAFVVEIGVGLLVPFVMLLQRSVRRSPRLLFIAVSLIIAGVVINRVDVFLTGYRPLNATVDYFPAIGEIALTAGLIATIMVLYRLVAMYFPILPGSAEEAGTSHLSRAPRRATGWAWFARVAAGLLIASFALVYACVHRRAEQATRQSFMELNRRPAVAGAVLEPLGLQGPTEFFTNPMPKGITISHPEVNELVDDYQPVRFMHKAHASHVGGDCTTCHHRVQEEADDRVGNEIDYLGLQRIRINACNNCHEFSLHRIHQTHSETRGDCSVCHHKDDPEFDREDLEIFKFSSCAACHEAPNTAEFPFKPGLKGAYHQQCIRCHEEQDDAAAPVGCQDCHHERVPDHEQHITLTGTVDPVQVTRHCLRCHAEQGQDVLHSAHWRWGGNSPNTAGSEERVDLGKKDVLNNYYIHVGSNLERCSQCHVGYGWKGRDFDFDDPANIDCLVCHDTTGTYNKDPGRAGLPAADVDLLAVARSVGRPSRKACGSCHFYGDGGANVKHGDLEPELADPEPDHDVHMGKHDMLCQDCHSTERHRIAGQSLAIPASEGRVTCEQCHGSSPHRLYGELGYHLDMHDRRIACQTCHIPTIARKTATKTFWDWSKAGEDREVIGQQFGRPTYSKKEGEFVWEMNVVPYTTWYNGKHTRHLLGDPIGDLDEEGSLVLNQPLGDIEDPASRIIPFKRFKGVSPYDKKHNTLAVPNLWGGYWKHFDWDRALADGMKSVGLEYSGEYDFIQTHMHWAINHTVVPKERALSCTDCHDREAVDCLQCHLQMPGFDVERLLTPRYPETAGQRIDLEGLGYKRDPALNSWFHKRGVQRPGDSE